MASLLTLSASAGASAIVVADAAVSNPAPAEHPDAAILALAPGLARLHALQAAAHDAEMDAENRAHDLARARLGGLAEGARHPDWHAALDRAKADTGFHDREAAHDQAYALLGIAIHAVAGRRAVTLEAILVKARYCRTWLVLEDSIIDDLVAMTEGESA